MKVHKHIINEAWREPQFKLMHRAFIPFICSYSSQQHAKCPHCASNSLWVCFLVSGSLPRSPPSVTKLLTLSLASPGCLHLKLHFCCYSFVIHVDHHLRRALEPISLNGFTFVCWKLEKTLDSLISAYT